MEIEQIIPMLFEVKAIFVMRAHGCRYEGLVAAGGCIGKFPDSIFGIDREKRLLYISP
jgi:hypothetical protein